ncbi:MAG: class E sortase [Acidimicrobiales bacterium]
MRVLGIIGKVLIGAGVIILLFVVYQVWGTAIQEGHTQNALRHTFVHDAKAKGSQLQKALEAAIAEDKLPTGPPVVAATTAQPAEGQPIGQIRIPVIAINQIVVQGTATQDLRKGPGHYIGTPLPGQEGNAAIAGHRTTYGHPFYNLNEVQPGDPIVLITLQGIFVYDATKSQVVSPNDNTALANSAGAHLTLTTCNPRFSASTRLVVTAVLAHSKLFAGVAQGTRKPVKPEKPQSGGLAGNTNGQLVVAVLWAAAFLLVLALVLVLAARFRRRRWSIYLVGTLGLLVVLYVFFVAVSPLLPASF